MQKFISLKFTGLTEPADAFRNAACEEYHILTLLFIRKYIFPLIGVLPIQPGYSRL
mgnify:CR=1 FL=1